MTEHKELIQTDNGKRDNRIESMASGYADIAEYRGVEHPETPSIVEGIQQRQAAGKELSAYEKLIIGGHEAAKKREEIDKKKLQEAKFRQPESEKSYYAGGSNEDVEGSE